MEIREGQTATNPKTGQKIVFKGGQWVNAGTAPNAGPNGRSAAEIKKRLADESQLKDLDGTERQFKRVKKLYEMDFKGVGPGSLVEFMPTQQRRRFDAANTMLSTQLKPLIRGPGEGPWTDADQARLDKLVPNGGNWDSDNEERLLGIESLIEERRRKHGGQSKPKAQPRQGGGGFKFLGVEE